MKEIVYLLFFGLGACSSLPVTITAPPIQDVQLQEVSDNVPRYIDQAVRWGGQIVEVANDDNYSTIQIVQFPLTSSGRPIVTKSSQGRFLAQSEQFFDPVIYKKGRVITFAGTIDSETTRTVDKKTLKLPVIIVSENHLWPKRNYVRHNYHLGYPYLYYGYGHRYPYWYYRGYGFRHHYYGYW